MTVIRRTLSGMRMKRQRGILEGSFIWLLLVGFTHYTPFTVVG